MNKELEEQIKLTNRFANQCLKLEQENKQLKEIEKEHQRINGELREENKQLQQRIDKAIDYLTSGEFMMVSCIIPDEYEETEETMTYTFDTTPMMKLKTILMGETNESTKNN